MKLSCCTQSRNQMRKRQTIGILGLALLASFLFASSCTSRKGSPQSPAADADGMFLVENASVSREAVEVGKYRIEAKQGNELFVTTIQFTERGKALPIDEYKKLKISELAKNFSEITGRLVATGDLQYRLADGTLVPCSVMPATEQDQVPL